MDRWRHNDDDRYSWARTDHGRNPIGRPQPIAARKTNSHTHVFRVADVVRQDGDGDELDDRPQEAEAEDVVEVFEEILFLERVPLQDPWNDHEQERAVITHPIRACLMPKLPTVESPG